MDDPFFIKAEDKFYGRSEAARKLSAKVVRVIKHQTGKTSIPEDRKIRAMESGKRISKNGNVYWETRRNRSDMNPRKKF